MNKVMLMYPPGKLFQRGEDRAQCNLEESAVATVHACNDLGYAAAVLRDGGYSVFLRDYQTEGADMNAVLKDMSDFAPDMVFMSVTNATVMDDIKVVDEMKKRSNFTAVLKGAIFFNPEPDLLDNLDLRNIDYLIGGEEEFIIRPLADYVFAGKGSIDDIDGLIYKKNGEFIKTRFDIWHNDLDSLPFPARDLMDNHLYPRPDTNEDMATVSVGRGCPCNCIYCLTPIISGKAVRLRSVENVFAELEECYYKYNIRNFFFKADTFTINNKWAIELCNKIIASPLHRKIEFTVNSRVDTVSEELLAKLKEAGCFTIAVGFESGNNDTLKRIKKSTTVDDGLKAAEMIKKSGIPLFGFFMIGFPWDTKETIKDTLDYILKIEPDFIEIHIAMPYYGTGLYELCREYNTLSDISYGFDYFTPNITGTETLGIDEVIKIKKRFLVKYYTRPSYLFKKIGSSITKPTVLYNYIQHGFKLLNRNLFH